MLEQKWEHNEAVRQKAYDSVRREVLHYVSTEFDILMKLVSLIKMCLTETHYTVWVGKHLSDILIEDIKTTKHTTSG